jgi:LysR family hydrogen peroxide-inducible transcriptional activator
LKNGIFVLFYAIFSIIKMRNLPSLKQLQYFLALSEHRHFGRAAAACFLSQSAFSHAIRELEETLGACLVDRTNRSVVITNTGRDVAVQARLCVQDAESLLDIARTDGMPLTGKLVLGVIPTIAPFLLPRIIPALRREHPDLELYLHEDKTAALEASLADGTVDALLLALPWPLRNAETQKLFNDPFHLAYCRNTKHVDPENFRTNRLTSPSILLLKDGHCLRDHALDACNIKNLDTVNRFSATSLLTLVEMVDADLGVTFIPEMAIHSGLLKGTRVKTRPLPKGNQREIGLAWRKNSGREKDFRLLGDFIRTHAGLLQQ